LLSYDAGERLLLAASLTGVRVPEEVSLMSFGHAPANTAVKGEAYIGCSVGVARVPSEKAGRAAVTMLLAKIARPQVKQSPTVIPLELEPGDTCARMSNGGRHV
jgi:DNA-binding LacI/PurR family transcriptional regulator